MTTADPDWNQVDTVLVDLDGTLLDLGFDDRFWRGRIPRAYAAHHGLAPDEAWHRLAGLFETTRGTLDWYCIDYWSRALDLDIAALKRAARHEVAWLPGAREFLGRVRATGRRLVLVTNAHPEALAIKDGHAPFSWTTARTCCVPRCASVSARSSACGSPSPARPRVRSTVSPLLRVCAT